MKQQQKLLLFLQLLLACFITTVECQCAANRLVWASCTGSGHSFDAVGNSVLFSLRATGLDIEGNFVDYPGDEPRDASSQQGANKLADDLATYTTQCPNQTIILGGYSQGVMVHKRAVLPTEIVSKVAAALIFGDPVPGNSFYPICDGSRVVATCGDDDPWCNNPDGGPRDKGNGVQNMPVPGNHQSAYNGQVVNEAVQKILNQVQNPFTGDCQLPAPPTIEFNDRLNWGR